jgi:transposase
MRRTAVVNQIQGLLLERGLTLPKGRCHLDNALPAILADNQSQLSESFRELLTQLNLEMGQLSERILGVSRATLCRQFPNARA